MSELELFIDRGGGCQRMNSQNSPENPPKSAKKSPKLPKKSPKKRKSARLAQKAECEDDGGMGTAVFVGITEEDQQLTAVLETKVEEKQPEKIPSEAEEFASDGSGVDNPDSEMRIKRDEPKRRRARRKRLDKEQTRLKRKRQEGRDVEEMDQVIN